MSTDCAAKGMGSVVEREARVPGPQGSIAGHAARSAHGRACLCRGGTRTNGRPSKGRARVVWAPCGMSVCAGCFFPLCVLDRDRGHLSKVGNTAVSRRKRNPPPASRTSHERCRCDDHRPTLIGSLSGLCSHVTSRSQLSVPHTHAATHCTAISLFHGRTNR